MIASTLEYRTIDRFPGYRFGNDGSVWTSLQRGPSRQYVPSETWRQLRLFAASNGYIHVSLRDAVSGRMKAFGVHRLILEAFRGPCPEGMEACHGPDRNRANNAITNLRWDSRKRNAFDRKQHGTDTAGERHHQAKLSVDDVREIRRMKRERVRLKDIASQFGVANGTIENIVYGRSWSCVQ